MLTLFTLAQEPMTAKIRLLLSLELIAYYFAAPYIILLALDDARGVLDQTTSESMRLWWYALLVGLYPLLQSFVSPCVGKRLDRRCSKVSLLRNIHLGNTLCYLLLSVAAFTKSIYIALFALCIPGICGCAAPVGKSLLASLTDAATRTKQFAFLAFLKGVVKLTAPLMGVVVFKTCLGEATYWPLFLVSAALSCVSFCISLSLSKIPFTSQNHSEQLDCPTINVFKILVKKHYRLLFVFVVIFLGYSVFVKFTPFVIFDRLSSSPSIVNYLSSIVGLASTLNQYAVWRYANMLERSMGSLFVLLCLSCIVFCLEPLSILWYVWLFVTLFCLSVLSTCIEAKLSLEGALHTQGRVQGVLYSFENSSYILAPLIGSLLASFDKIYPLYFVLGCAFSACTAYLLTLKRQKKGAVSPSNS